MTKDFVFVVLACVVERNVGVWEVNNLNYSTGNSGNKVVVSE